MKTLQDLTAPAEVEPTQQSEAEHQARCVAWMRARGYWARKFSSISQRSVPDYLFARDFVRTAEYTCDELKIATEFKRPGTKPRLLKERGVTVMSTLAQYDEQQAMRAAGWHVFENADFYAFKMEVERLERAQTV